MMSQAQFVVTISVKLSVAIALSAASSFAGTPRGGGSLPINLMRANAVPIQKATPSPTPTPTPAPTQKPPSQKPVACPATFTFDVTGEAKWAYSSDLPKTVVGTFAPKDSYVYYPDGPNGSENFAKPIKSEVICAYTLPSFYLKLNLNKKEYKASYDFATSTWTIKYCKTPEEVSDTKKVFILGVTSLAQLPADPKLGTVKVDTAGSYFQPGIFSAGTSCVAQTDDSYYSLRYDFKKSFNGPPDQLIRLIYSNTNSCTGNGTYGFTCLLP